MITPRHHHTRFLTVLRNSPALFNLCACAYPSSPAPGIGTYVHAGSAPKASTMSSAWGIGTHETRWRSKQTVGATMHGRYGMPDGSTAKDFFKNNLPRLPADVRSTGLTPTTSASLVFYFHRSPLRTTKLVSSPPPAPAAAWELGGRWLRSLIKNSPQPHHLNYPHHLNPFALAILHH